ncbi:hypothetical protein EI94DRAFT_1743976 [Lactarius quietus]|nr:hypothetical protein EI94DRAFT_1743976 [Lactarius quietus]
MLGANPISVQSYQSQGWTIAVHPEGNPYAHIKVPSGITVVTVACISEPGITDQLNAWLSTICNMITEKHIHLPETSHLFLQIHKDSGSCNYYFADHSLRTVFWLHTLDRVTLRPQRSSCHLQHALEENYWTHVGLFPETSTQHSVQALNELRVAFLHAGADVCTSGTPTLPYTAKQREEILDILERNKNNAPSTCIITYVARLWTAVANHRFLSGEDHCRLSSGRSTSEIAEWKWGLVLGIISNILLFGFPDRYQARFKSLWVDQLVNTRRWQEHISETVEDLKQTMSSLFPILEWLTQCFIICSANVHMMPLSSFPAFSSSSLLLCVTGLVTVFVLIQEQRRLLITNTRATVINLNKPDTSYLCRQTAMVHSLPEALITWALLLFAMQSFWMTFAHFPLPMSIRKVLRPCSKAFEDAPKPVPVPSLIPA